MARPKKQRHGSGTDEDELARRMSSGAGRKLQGNLQAAGWSWTQEDGASRSDETDAANPDED